MTLNDPVFVEAAQALARRMVREGGARPGRARRATASASCTARQPDAEPRLAALVALLRAASSRAIAGDAAARAASRTARAAARGADLAELAAWTVVANVLLNLDERSRKELTP